MWAHACEDEHVILGGHWQRRVEAPPQDGVVPPSPGGKPRPWGAGEGQEVDTAFASDLDFL